MADIFTMMFAGHGRRRQAVSLHLLKTKTETTASVLAATLGYLSIHQDEQEKAYREVMDRVSRMGTLVREHTSLSAYMLTGFKDIEEPEILAHLMSCFIEAGRLIRES